MEVCNIKPKKILINFCKQNIILTWELLVTMEITS